MAGFKVVDKWKPRTTSCVFQSGPLEEVDMAASPAPQPLLARATPDLVGFGPFDYISDSQLQDISLM